MGRRIGDILEVNPEFIFAESGIWFGSDESRVHYVRRACVADEVGTHRRLSVSSDELEALGFLLPPTGSPFATDLWPSRDGRDIDFPTQGPHAGHPLRVGWSGDQSHRPWGPSSSARA